MERILEEKKLKNKDILNQDCNSKEKQYNEIHIKQLTGLRKKQNRDLIMERRKQYSQNNKKSTAQIEEHIRFQINEDTRHLPLVLYFIYFLKE